MTILTIHIIDGQLADDMIKELIRQYSINHLFIINPEPIRIYYPLETAISLEKEENIMDLARKVKDEIARFTQESKCMFCLDTDNQIILLTFLMMATIFDAQTYSLSNPRLIIPRMQIQTLGNQETLFLSALYRLNGSSESLGLIAAECGWGEENDPKGVQKASYVANKLRKLSLIELDKEGRKVSVKMTEKAEVYTELVFAHEKMHGEIIIGKGGSI